MTRFLVMLFLVLPSLALGQGVASIVSDALRIEDGNRLIASGNVEVLYGDARLSASEVIYTRASDRLQIIGPIFISYGENAFVMADEADLDPTLENGVLRSARLVLDSQLQLAANRIDRQDGRYNQLYKTAVSSCQVCDGRTALWDIRAEKVIHDTVEQQLYFTNPVFRVRGVPLFWLPQVRLPDPSLRRATGFLIPQVRTTNRLSTGIKLPYFITIGPHRDLTLSPYLSAKTRTLEARYRQAFENGDLTVDTAFSRDELFDGRRSYLFADGSFLLRNDMAVEFDIERVSDPAYLQDYNYSGKDRLDSEISIRRIERDQKFFASSTYFESLRDDEINAQLPPLVGDYRYQSRREGPFGTIAHLGTSGDFLFRQGSGTGDAGRDMLRVGGDVQLMKGWQHETGIMLDAQTGVSADVFKIWDDPSYPDPLLRVVPSVSATLRFPLQKSGSDARYLLEPVLSFAWSDVRGDTPPFEDSTRPELDRGNLFALNRFPGEDAIEDGTRVAGGVQWTRLGLQGSATRLTFGRVTRDVTNPAFTKSSGLDGFSSDWLVAGQYDTGQGLRFDASALADDNFDATIGSANVTWNASDFSIKAGYIWQTPDPDINRDSAAAAWSLDARLKLNEAWAIDLDANYDVDADTPTRAGVGFEWRNECVTVDFAVQRRYTSSRTLAPSTDYGLSIALSGFSTGRSSAGPKVQCQD